MDCELSQKTYEAFAAFLERNVGIVLGGGRQYLVRSRLSSFSHNNNYSSLDACLLDIISGKGGPLTQQCLELMTTNETFWFRDNYPFNLLFSNILPAFEAKQRKLRIWSSACASGQEPYSIAMKVAQYKKMHPAAFPGGINILATDFSAKMIALAASGIYDDMALNRGLDNSLKQEYFEPKHNTQQQNAMQIASSIRGMVTFKHFNLLSDFTSLGEFDIIFCRNVLIYFNGNQKSDILKKFAASLPISGVLMLGAAESISGAETSFKMTSNSTGLYYSKL